MQVYSDPSRESDPHALPNIEVFYLHDHECSEDLPTPGWYYWSCFPGCLPDGDPVGPFATAEEAKAAAQS